MRLRMHPPNRMDGVIIFILPLSLIFVFVDFFGSIYIWEGDGFFGFFRSYAHEQHVGKTGMGKSPDHNIFLGYYLFFFTSSILRYTLSLAFCPPSPASFTLEREREKRGKMERWGKTRHSSQTHIFACPAKPNQTTIHPLWTI